MPTSKLPERVVCIFCGAQVAPREESLQSWRRVFNDGVWFYACPLEFPPINPPIGVTITFGDRLRADERFILAAAHVRRLMGQETPPAAAVAAAGGAR